MQAYSEMKDSEVEWLGRIPQEWSLSKISANFRRKKIRGMVNEELLSVYRDYGVVIKSSRDDNHNASSEDLSNYQLVEAGDLVTNKMKTWQGSIAISEYRGIVSPAYFILSPTSTKMVPKYIHYLLRSPIYIAQYNRFSKGIRIGQWDLEYEQFKTFPLLLPPHEIQQKIADYLDTETAQIDNLIAKQERLLELLEEKRRATITHAVTRGLDPSVELKETNIPWLGQVPAHWTVEKFSNLYLNTNAGEVIPKEYWDPNGVELLYTASQNPIHSNFAAFPQQKRTSRGDILIARNGDGVIHDPQPDSIYTNVVQRIRLDTLRLDKGYIIYALKASLGYVHGQSNGDFIVSLNMGMWNKTRLALPKLSEQRVIREHLDSELEKNERLKQKIQTQITLLRERRTSLISHAVTGKVKI